MEGRWVLLPRKFCKSSLPHGLDGIRRFLPHYCNARLVCGDGLRCVWHFWSFVPFTCMCVCRRISLLLFFWFFVRGLGMPDALYSKVLNLKVEAEMQAEPALLWREQHTARSRTGPGDLRLYWKLCFLGFRVSCILGFECVPLESHALSQCRILCVCGRFFRGYGGRFHAEPLSSGNIDVSVTVVGEAVAGKGGSFGLCR